MKKIQTRKSQAGVMLIEALVAILIFSIGVIAVMGMQTVSIQQVSQAKYRTDASYLANEIIGTMWTDPANFAVYQSCTSPNCIAWQSTIASTLPAGSGTIVVNGTMVTVTVVWKMPNETTQRQFVSIANINPS